MASRVVYFNGEFVSESEARALTENFPAILTALHIQRMLSADADYAPEARRLREIMQRIARGSYPDWRNEQRGARPAGKTVAFRSRRSRGSVARFYSRPDGPARTPRTPFPSGRIRRSMCPSNAANRM